VYKYSAKYTHEDKLLRIRGEGSGSGGCAPVKAEAEPDIQVNWRILIIKSMNKTTVALIVRGVVLLPRG
jgi:hypothetical protein